MLIAAMNRLVLLVVLTFVPQVVVCHEQAAAKAGGPYYYATFKTKSLPEKQLRELSQQDAASKPTYYVAYFSYAGGVERFSKYINGKLEWESVYDYSPDGRLRAGRTFGQESKNQVTTEYVFDADGEVASRTVRTHSR